ncbi:MAG: phosphosulfolactate synthase [Bacteroidota bacterium]|nr:MAG: phosphosulfolactate synthase [Bacteroidota bacterium]
MTNISLPYMPQRPAKPRSEGLTMMMDKGLSLRQAEDFIESSGEFTDYVKLGFGTSVITTKLAEKVSLYQKAGLQVYFGGTLFEAFIIRGMFDEYRKYIDKFNVKMVEVSDGSMHIDHDKKLEYIQKLATSYTVVSEVGSKVKGVNIEPADWVSMMKSELQAGSVKVIAESRESGTIGIYNADGSVNESLINAITTGLKSSDIIWEAPNGKQQIWFIKIFGPNVNLGNIAPEIVVPLECLRVGLRGDTFFDSLPKELHQFMQL